MIRKLLILGATVAAATALAPAAYAGSADASGQFYATPIQKGAPRDLPGEQMIPGVSVAVDAVDAVTRPLIVDPIQGVGASLAPPTAPAPEPAPAMHMHHHHHHHMMRMHKHMMKKAM